MIISRYITKEVVYTFFAVTGVLLLIALSNRFVIFLAKAAVGQMPVSLIFKTVGLYVPELFTGIAPLGLFLGILLAHGRLHADNEMVVMLTGGVDWKYIVGATFKLALVISAVVFWLTIWLLPTIAEYREKVLAQGEAMGVMQAITPGQFQTLSDGNVVFYVEDLDQSKAELSKIFITEQARADQSGQGKQITTITAQSGFLKPTEGEQGYFLVLNNGIRYSGNPGTANYSITEFARYGRELKMETTEVPDIDRLKSSSSLWSSESIGDQAELQWRLAIPLSVFVLALMAVPLAKVKPRQGRFAKFLPALLIYIVYYNLMTLAKRWVSAGALPATIGIWLVHLIFLLLAAMILAHNSGRLNQLYQAYVKKSPKGTR